MSRRNNFLLTGTPNYGLIGKPDLFTIKLYYNGRLKSGGKHGEYIGGSFEYFDSVDLDMLGMIELWGFAEDLGFKDKDSIKFWHKVKGTLNEGKYLENDSDVLNIRNYILINYEVEICIEHLDGQNVEGETENVDDFDVSEYAFVENDVLVDAFVGHDDETTQGKMVCHERGNTHDMINWMQKDDIEEDVCADSDGLGSLYDSDEDEVKNYPIFHPKQDFEDLKLKLGLVFSSKKEAKFTIESHCIRDGRPVKFVKNDNIRLWAKCKDDNCHWIIHVAKMTNDSCWQVRNFVDNHSNCARDYANKCINSTWLAKTYVKKFSINPKLGPLEFREEICTTLQSDISRKVAYLAKRKAIKLVQGSADEQFQQIRKYCAELKRSDPGATIILKLTEDDEGSRFQRLYVCFSACRQGFKDACRRLIGVDRCFLKVQHGGQLLSAVGLDPNNNIFPICYAMVERETKDSWSWFLRLLDQDLGVGNDQHTWTFMSDKQKGLIHALESLFPDAEHRFCVRHLQSNMKRDGFKSVAVKIALWAVAKTTTIEEFKFRMAELKDIDSNAYEWLAKKPESHWSKAYFSTTPKSDILLNNMCESFNSFILDARDKPVIEMFEIIRNLLMGRFQKNRERAEKWNFRICSKIKDLLSKIYVQAIKYSPMKSDEMHYQITRSDDRHDQHSVDLSRRSCSCRKYDLTGIPCKHAVCAIWCKKDDPEAYVHPFYLVETYRRCNASRIMSVNGPDLWPQCYLPPPLPPRYEEKVGRPEKLRRREADEPPPFKNKLKGVTKFTKCKICGGSGHNKRTCNRNDNVQHKKATQQESTTQQSRTVPDKVVSNLRKPQKLPVKRSQIGVHIEGSSCSISSINVNQSVNIHKPAFMKGGINFTTVSRLRSSSSVRGRVGQSSSSTANHLVKPTSSQGSVKN